MVVEEERALRTMAAYIDLNPVRAGIVSDPADYRWSGDAGAMVGKARARRGLVRIIGQMAWPRATAREPNRYRSDTMPALVIGYEKEHLGFEPVFLPCWRFSIHPLDRQR